MSPFTQITEALNPHAGIDRQFSPILNYIDEFDRHFSHRHRFLNCFIPRFDLEEDPQTYFLYGEIPGADVSEITIEASHDDHSLTVFGTTHRPGQANHAVTGDAKTSGAPDNDNFIKVDVSDAGKPIQKEYVPPTTPYAEPIPAPRPANSINVDASNAGIPRPRTPPPSMHTHEHTKECHHEAHREQEHPHHKRRVLLSERIVGDFHRTFTFPAPVEVDAVQAKLENGVLRLVVPKKEGVRERRRIAIKQ